MLRIPRANKDVQQLDFINIASGNAKWYIATLKLQFPIKLNIYLPHYPTIPLLGIYPRETKTYVQRKICPQIFTAAPFLIAKNRNNPHVLQQWMHKLLYIGTMNYSAIEKNELFIHKIMWMNLKDIELN